MNDLHTFGFLFEALCERDLRIYAETFGAKAFHYQDYQNREIDTVIELSDGNWCAFEIKLGANQIDNAAANLTKIRNDIAKDPKGIPPKVLCVMCDLRNGNSCLPTSRWRIRSTDNSVKELIVLDSLFLCTMETVFQTSAAVMAY